ncbi:MAG: helix-turn-helix domain-containing protein [Verrucomicrobiota bacterium]
MLEINLKLEGLVARQLIEAATHAGFPITDDGLKQVVSNALEDAQSYRALKSKLGQPKNQAERLAQRWRNPQAHLESIEKLGQDYFDVTTSYLHSRRRDHQRAWVRQVIMWAQRNHTDASLETIGEYWNKDHGTVIHACRLVEDVLTLKDDRTNTIGAFDMRCAEFIDEAQKVYSELVKAIPAIAQVKEPAA